MSSVAYVVISGLPGSGKSTLARSLAERLSLPLIDKDVILESLYDSLGVGDHAWRSRLSRASDDIMLALAADARRAVLDNWSECGKSCRRWTSAATSRSTKTNWCRAPAPAARFLAPPRTSRRRPSTVACHDWASSCAGQL